MRSIYPLLILLGLLPACGDNGGTTDGTTDGAATDAPTTEDEPTAGDSTGDPAADLNERELGASATQACLDAKTHVVALATAAAEGDAAAASAAYTGTPLQTFVKQLDTANERTDDVLISMWLTTGNEQSLVAASAHIHVAYMAELRSRLSSAEMDAEDRFTAWDEAHCLWDSALRTLAEEADNVTWHAVPETIVADIDAAFQAGHDGISGEPPATAIDDWRVPPAKQRIEKSLFRAAQRVIVELSFLAQKNDDLVAARRALELFDTVQDRLEGRNTPGIQQVKDIFAGDPMAIDPMAVLTELDIAFAKRTRNYADQAITGDEVGVPAGYKGAVEGNTYALLLVPGMTLKLGAAFILQAYVGEWGAYADLVRTGADLPSLMTVSQRLIDQTCAYQTALGIAACTGDADETE